MTPEALEQILDVLDVLATVGIVAAVIIRFHGKQQSLTILFFCFAMVSLLLTNVYWLAHSLLRPNMRMPLAANTIGECAVFLLLSAALNSLFPDSRSSFTPQLVCTVLFTVASIYGLPGPVNGYRICWAVSYSAFFCTSVSEISARWISSIKQNGLRWGFAALPI